MGATQRPKEKVRERLDKTDQKFRWSRDQVRQHEHVIGLMLDAFASEAQIARALAERHGVKATRVHQLLARVRAKRDEELAKEAKHHRTKQIRSLERSLSQIEGIVSSQLEAYNKWEASGRRGKAAKPPAPAYFEKKARLVEMLSDLTGTRSPIVVEHHLDISESVQDALVQAIANVRAGDPEYIEGEVVPAGELLAAENDRRH